MLVTEDDGTKVYKIMNPEKNVSRSSLYDNSNKLNNYDIDSDVSENPGVKELAAVITRLESEHEIVHEFRKLHIDGKLAISLQAFKEEAASCNTATVVKKQLEKTSACFSQYFDCLVAQQGELAC